jgi:SAM-dependent methyltransferase
VLVSPSIKDIFKKKSFINIDLGGGDRPQKGFINIDIRDLPGVDIVHDLEVFPWPLPDNCADLLVAAHLIEHINPHKGGFIRFMDEAWRVTKPGGQFMVSTPYGVSYKYVQDPTHVNPCNEATFAYFDPLDQFSKGELYKVYRPKPWKIVQVAFKIDDSLEVLLEKRLDDKSYHV